MKILVIENDDGKRDEIINLLNKKNIEYEIQKYVTSALIYIFTNRDIISGIILDLGLQTSSTSDDYTIHRGLDILEQMERREIYHIPVLINSTTFVGMLDDEYPFVYGQRTNMQSYRMLEKFITFLKKREER